MNNLNKNILRYALKNKFSLAGLFILFSICMSSLLTLGLLSNNFSRTYDSVVQNGNRHNIVMNELYLSSTDGDNNKKELLDLLQSPEAKEENINARRFEGLTVQSSPEAQSKIIRYEPNYPSQYNTNGIKYIPSLTENTLPTDNLQVFIQSGLPYLEAEYLNKIQRFYHLPRSIDFTGILNFVQSTFSENLTGKVSELSVENAKILKARQAIIYFLAKGENTTKEYTNLLNTIINSNDNTDVSTIDPKEVQSTKKYFSQFFNPTDSNYNFPIVSGSSISFQGTKQISITPEPVIRFEDYTSRICIIPPAILTHQNKKVYSYDEFKKNCNNLSDQNPDSIYTKNTIGLKEFDEYFNSIPDSYKVKVDSIDYLIVGGGITPDFFYPIVSFENTVVDFQHELTIYTNNNGFKRTQHSFQSAPLESLILIKYSGNIAINKVINDLNVLAEKYLAFPAGTKNTYAANDESNTFSPTAARIQFIEQLVTIVDAITILLSIFLTVITLFIVVIILNKFISENKKTLYILVAQGISKFKAILPIILLPLFPCLLASIFSYLLAHFTQENVFNLFSAYWPLETFTNEFNVFIIIGVFLAFYIVTSIVSFIIGINNLKSSVSSGINVSPAKLGPLAIAVKKPFAKFGVVTKFRVSLAFGSFTKLMFLAITLLLSIFTISFFTSTISSFSDSLSKVIDTNRSTMQMNLVTPTRNGGQYFATTFDDAGKLIVNPNDKNDVLNPPSFANSTKGYGKYYSNPVGSNIPLFKEWSSLLLISPNDATKQNSELRYMANVTNWEFLMNIKVLGTTNPWTDIASPLLPSNQRNASSQFMSDLYSKLLSDNRIIKTSPDGISKKALSNNYMQSLTEFYLVNFDYDKDYVKIDDNVYPIIRLEKNNNLSILDNEQIKNEILLTYGDVFDTNIEIQDLLFDNTNPNILKIVLKTPQKVLTSRHLFEVFFKSNKPTITVYDQILNEYRNEFSNDSSKLFGLTTLTLTPAFLNYAIYILTTPDYQSYIYKNSYNLTVLNKNDEPYTYVDASFINPDNGELFDKFDSKYQYKNNINIIGIQENSKFINLVNESNESINHKLFNINKTYINGREDLFPLIPNLYAKELYNLKIGDKIKIFATNNVDRYNPILITKPNDNNQNSVNYHNEYLDAYTRTYEIVDFANSTKDSEFYTSMSAAQKTIGLAYNENNKLELSKNIDDNIISEIYPSFDVNKNYSLINEFNRFGGFNGVFSSNDLIGLSNELALYSPSGLYPGTSELSNNVAVMKSLIFNNLVGSEANNDNWEILANALYLTNQETQEFKTYNTQMKLKTLDEKNLYVEQIINKLSSIYRKTAFFSMIDTPSSVQASVSTFTNLTKLINSVEMIIIFLILFLSCIVLIVTSWIIIKDLTQLIVLLKVQGVSDWNNTLNILSIFFPTLIIAGILTLPILYGSLILFKNTIFVAMGLVVTPSISWLGFFLAFMGAAMLLTLILIIAKFYVKKINLVESLKW